MDLGLNTATDVHVTVERTFHKCNFTNQYNIKLTGTLTPTLLPSSIIILNFNKNKNMELLQHCIVLHGLKHTFRALNTASLKYGYLHI